MDAVGLQDDVANLLGELPRLLYLPAVRLLHEENVRSHVVVRCRGHLRLDDAVLVPLKEIADVQ
tara:strand:+ start:122 stop:313 length:192 start_codon:yes stop_codon:yes gene_type:complete